MTAHPPDYYRRLRERHAAGDHPLLPVASLLPHLVKLRAWGVSICAISTASGVSKPVVGAVLRGERPTMNAAAARSLAALTLDDVLRAETDLDVLVPGAGTRRRIQANLLAGWAHQDQHEMCGVHTQRVLGGGGRVLLRTHLTVAALSTRLAGTPGPSLPTKARAARAGYLPLSVWDDVDDPDCRPAEAVPAVAASGRYAAADLLTEVRLLADEPLHVAAVRLSMGTDALEQALSRAGIEGRALLAGLRAASARWRDGARDVAS